MKPAFLSVWLLLLLSCSGSEAGETTISIDYQLFKRDVNSGCDGVPEVREVEVTLFNTNGITPRSGWPRKAPCSGNFSAEGLDPGPYVLQVAALGDLQGDSAAVLYQARTNLTLPAASLSLSLEPQVAFLDLGWTFGSEMLAPCATGVESIDVLVSAGGGDPWMGRYACTDTPIQIEDPFSLQNYTIQVIGNSSEGFPLFTADAQRTLDRGLNEYIAVLEPRGGQVRIDFEFLTAGVPTRSCDAPDVMATDVTAVINELEGTDSVNETFSCMEERPYVFTAARFTQGRRLEIELIADAVNRFKGIQRFTMPSGDYFTGVMTMVPVGSGTVMVAVASSTCAGDVERYDISVRATQGGSGPALFETSIEPPDDQAEVVDLPYGSYFVTVEERIGGAVRCTLEEQRTISGRENDWDLFEF